VAAKQARSNRSTLNEMRAQRAMLEEKIAKTILSPPKRLRLKMGRADAGLMTELKAAL
jgi:hypothetical protein